MIQPINNSQKKTDIPDAVTFYGIFTICQIVFSLKGKVAWWNYTFVWKYSNKKYVINVTFNDSPWFLPKYW